LAFTTTTGAGGTSLIGTSGVDTATVAGNSFPLYIGAQAANDVVVLTGSTKNLRSELGKGADNFTAAGFDTSTVSGNLGNDVITLTGTVTGSNALVNGNQGADSITLTGSTITKGARILGGADNDTITVGTATISQGGVINGNKGEDTITVGTSATAMSNSTIYGGEGNDTMSADDAAVIFSGDDGEDNITGSDKADTLFGGAGNDTISGDTAIDSFIDSVIGGAGNDTFKFLGNAGATVTTVNTAGDSADIITDFTVGEDKINTGTAYAFGGVVTNATTNLTDEVLYAISGTLSSAGDFTASTIAAGGFDTLIAVGAAGNLTVSATQTLVVLKNVLATSLTSASFTA
jgi:Ca2+-binding RTX toxin-like protein